MDFLNRFPERFVFFSKYNLSLKYTAIKCPDLVAPANGNIAQSGKGHEAQATITCDRGYTYNEPLYQQITCQADGTWSGRLGSCKG